MARKIAYSSMLTALAMILSYVEALIPFSVGVAGIKLGLANLVVLTGIYYMPTKQVFVISVARIVLSAFMFGNMASLIYSMAGCVVSLLVMLLIKKLKCFSIVGVSIAGGTAHNIGQFIVAACVLKSRGIIYYLPLLMIGGAVAGLIVGIVAEQVRRIIKNMILHNDDRQGN